ncbi:MAG: 50S ribosomal protein L18 [Candidatus Jorgensenbacteria bacterium]|nr:50S ribosomal protein L18 [Candidatus Jorgensenbacteria bacterium]
MNKAKKQNAIRARRAHRVRARISGTKEKPRLSIFRSNRFTYAQLIDDEAGKTLAAASSHKEKGAKAGKKIESAGVIGKHIAEQAKKAGINTAVLDRGKYRYHGRVKAVVDAAREAGLKI